MKPLLSLIGAAVAPLLIVVAISTMGSAEAAMRGGPARGQDILFVGSSQRLYVVRPDGTHERRLGGARNVWGPVWSPGGKWIAYGATRTRGDICPQLYVMRADGTHARRLTRARGCYLNPTWAPNGKRIAFEAWGGALKTGIWAMNVNGTGLRLLTDKGNMPAWSPDGRTIAFRSTFPEAIWLMDADGSNLGQLTTPKQRVGLDDVDMQPAWSPNGKWIAFSREHPVGHEWHWDVYAVRSDGSGLRQLTDRFGHSNTMPDWSPTGMRIAFVSDRARRGVGDIYVMKANGTGKTRLTKTGDAQWPSWRRLGRSVRGALRKNADAPRTLVVDKGLIRAFAQDARSISWVGRSYKVHIRNLQTRASAVVGSAAAPYYAAGRPALAVAGTRALWSKFEGGNAPDTSLWTAALGERAFAVDLFMGDSGDPGGIFLSGVGGDAPILLYGKTFEGCSPPPWPPAPCPILQASGGVMFVTGQYEPPPISGIPPAAILAFTAHDPGQGRISQGLLAIAPAASPLTTELYRVPRVAQDGPVQVYRLLSKVVPLSAVQPQGTVRALALDFGRLAVLVERANGSRAIERYDPKSGRLITTTALPRTTAPELSIGSVGLVYRVGRKIYLLTGRKPKLVWTAGGTPIGLSVEGRRIAWAVNLKGRGRVVALTLP
jgi:Tol biopolymer transport system component